jgi:hypothetical protein
VIQGWIVSERIAGAPISWGVSEVPGWGHQMRCERVLAEMRGLGLAATEAGPDGFLPDDPGALLRMPGRLRDDAGERIHAARAARRTTDVAP